MSFVCALALPAVSASMYFYYTVDNSNKSNNSNNTIRRNEETTEIKSVEVFQIDTVVVTNSATNLHTKSIFSYKRAFALLWTHFKTSFSNKSIILWSVWWALATCGMYQVRSIILVALFIACICVKKRMSTIRKILFMFCFLLLCFFQQGRELYSIYMAAN